MIVNLLNPSGRNENRLREADKVITELEAAVGKSRQSGDLLIQALEDAVERSSESNNFLIKALEDMAQSKTNEK